MLRTMLQAKLHGVRVTHAHLHYEGSCGIDEDLVDAAGMLVHQHIEIYNVSNGERFTTYILPAARGSGEISLNGAAARKAAVGDVLIVCAYSSYSASDLKEYKPTVILVNGMTNHIASRR